MSEKIFSRLLPLITLACMAQDSTPVRMVHLGNRVEAVVGGRIVVIDPHKGTWKPLAKGLPLISEGAPAERVIVPRWDGFNAYRDIAGYFPSKAYVQSGFQEMTTHGRTWYWRAGVELKEGERVLSTFDDKALVRLDQYGPQSQWRPPTIPTRPGPSKVVLYLIDLVSGNRTEIFARDIPEPYDLQFATAQYQNEVFLFANTGAIHKITFGSNSLQTIQEDFWGLSGLDLFPGPPWFDGPLLPRFNSFPFFDTDGGILLAFEAVVRTTHSGEALAILFEKAPEKRIIELKKKKLYPFVPDKNYDFGDFSAVLLKFEPEAKTIKIQPASRFQHLCQVNPESNRGSMKWNESSGQLFVGPGGRISWFNLPDLKQEVPPEPPAKGK